MAPALSPLFSVKIDFDFNLKILIPFVKFSFHQFVDKQQTNKSSRVEKKSFVKTICQSKG